MEPCVCRAGDRPRLGATPEPTLAAPGPCGVPALSNDALFCDLGRVRAHNEHVLRRVWIIAAGCVLTVQCACGLETIELRERDGDRDVGEGEAGDGAEMTPPSSPGAGVSPPNTSSAEGSGDPPLLSGSGNGFDEEGFASPPAPVARGCKKVDFLFVIDNSFSMSLAQDNLRNSFAGFMSVIQDEVDADDFHIMVVDTDAWENDDARADDGDTCRSVLGAGRRTNGDTGAD